MPSEPVWNAPLPDAAPAPVASTAPATPSIVDRSYPAILDRTLPRPTSMNLMALGPREAKFFCVAGSTDYEAIVDLQSGCVKEAAPIPRRNGDPLSAVEGKTDGEVIATLVSEAGQAEAGKRLAGLARFQLNAGAHGLTHELASGTWALSRDHRKLAMTIGNRVFYSGNGGQNFERVGADVRATMVNFVHFGEGDRTLLVEYWPEGEPPQRRMLFVDVAPDGTAKKRGTLDLGALWPWGSAKGPIALFIDRPTHCIQAVDPVAMKLTEVRCFPQQKSAFFPHLSPNGAFGTYTDAGADGKPFDVIFSTKGGEPRKVTEAIVGNLLGPDDEGRVAWKRKAGGFRLETATAKVDLPGSGELLGFDLEGNLLVFDAPAGAPAPFSTSGRAAFTPPPRPSGPARRPDGTLEDVECTLLKRLGPSDGKPARP